MPALLFLVLQDAHLQDRETRFQCVYGDERSAHDHLLVDVCQVGFGTLTGDITAWARVKATFLLAGLLVS